MAWRPLAHDPVDAREVGVDDLVPRLLVHAQQQRVLGDPGVGHQDLDGAQASSTVEKAVSTWAGSRHVAGHREEVDRCRRVSDRLPAGPRSR